MTAEVLPFERPVDVAVPTVVDLASLSEAALGALLAELGEKPFRARQVFAWLHGKRVTSTAAMTDLSQGLRDRLAARGAVRRPVVDDVKVAADGTRKYQLKTHDGHVIESVWIPHASGPGRHALCISSQVGCAMGCAFCATASLNLTRHLEPGEIVGQVYAVVDDLDRNLPEDPPLPSSKLRWRYDPVVDTELDPVVDTELDPEVDPEVDPDDDCTVAAAAPVRAPRLRPRRVQNIVYMGMGEPLHNLDHVIASIGLLTHARGYGLSPRRITVSTSGMVAALGRLGQETAVHLAISLNATTNETRRSIMPVTKRWDIEALLAACAAFPLERRRRITFEYVLLAGVNDSDDDARRLVDLLRGQRSKVNLIPFNAHPLSPFSRPSDERVESFRSFLDRAGLSCFVRTTRGLDIDAACGMLGAKKLETARASLPVVG
jgi:23S rRNA (adenine2503-C2)-methyltransferase